MREVVSMAFFQKFHHTVELSPKGATGAGVAQLAEQPICNRQVAGSSPIASSSSRRGGPVKEDGGSGLQHQGQMAEWLMAADCKSAELTLYVGSNPTPTMDPALAGPGAR